MELRRRKRRHDGKEKEEGNVGEEEIGNEAELIHEGIVSWVICGNSFVILYNVFVEFVRAKSLFMQFFPSLANLSSPSLACC